MIRRDSKLAKLHNEEKEAESGKICDDALKGKLINLQISSHAPSWLCGVKLTHENFIKNIDGHKSR